MSVSGRRSMARRRKQRSPWKIREESLGRLGFESYSDYLESDLWKRVRRRVFASKGKKCVFCGLKASQVHHHSYAIWVMEGRDLAPLSPVCNRCHDHGSVTKDGYVRTPKTATRAMRRLANKLKRKKKVRRRKPGKSPEAAAVAEKQRRARLQISLNRARARLEYMGEGPRAKRVRKRIRKLEADLA